MKRTVIGRATTGLAGALAIAGGSQAYGTVISSATPADILPTTFPTTTTSSVDWDVDNNGVVDFNFTFRQPQNPTGVDWQTNVFALAGTSVLSAVGSYFYYPQALTLGSAVAASGAFSFIPGTDTGEQNIIASRFRSTNYGYFQPPTSQAFLGFTFTSGVNILTGYLQIKVGRSFGIDFINAAYNDVPGGTITAGQAAVPEPGTLGSLALGAAGLAGAAGWKRRKAVKALA